MKTTNIRNTTEGETPTGCVSPNILEIYRPLKTHINISTKLNNATQSSFNDNLKKIRNTARISLWDVRGYTYE